jgi:hypothetical protein
MLERVRIALLLPVVLVRSAPARSAEGHVDAFDDYATPRRLRRRDPVLADARQDEVCNRANRNGGICQKVAFGDASPSNRQCDLALRRSDLSTRSRCAGHVLTHLTRH